MKSRRSWAGRILAVAALVAAYAGMTAGPSAAHADLVRTNPANGSVLAEAPAVAELRFSGSVRLVSDSIRVRDADGRRLVTPSTSEAGLVSIDLPDTLPTGSYVIDWHVVSEDGHPLSGTIAFSIGSPSPSISASSSGRADAETLMGELRRPIQGAQYVALLLAAGLVSFGLLVPADTPRRARRRLGRVTAVAATVATAAGFALIPSSGAVGSQWVAAFLVLGGLGVAARAPGRAVQAVGAISALAAPALVGHTRSVSPSPLLIAADLTHLVAGAIWFGGLVGLVMILPALRANPVAVSRVLSRFSTAAAASLVVLVAMGTLLAARILGSWDALLHTTYGVMLMVKLAIVAAAVLVASANRFLLVPRVRRSASGTATRLIRHAVALEAALLTSGIVLTGYLSSQAPH